MALPITDNLKQGLRGSSITPTLVLKIDGLDTVFGNVQIKKYVRIGDPDLLIGDDWIIGGFNVVSDQTSYITYNTGTTTKIAQKLDPSKGLGSSVSQMAVTLIDKNAEMIRLVSPGYDLNEIMGRYCTVYLGIEESSWPEDYNVVFRGIVQNLDAASTFVTLYLNNTEEKKRAKILDRISLPLTADANYHSVLFQDIFYKNRADVTNTITVTYIDGATAGSEIVTLLTPTSIQVEIEDGVSTASQIRKAVENSSDANQLVEAEIEGDNDAAQFIGSAVLGTDTTLTFEDTTLFYEPADSGVMKTYVKINDELLEYTGKTATTLTGVTRGAYNSTPAVHRTGDDAEQIVRLNDRAMNLALKLMLSPGPTYYAEGVEVKSFFYYSPDIQIANAIFFNAVDIQTVYGVAVGDLVTVELATNGGNNVVDATIAEVGLIDDGSYIILNSAVISEIDSPAVAKFKSQFNTLPLGLGMKPRDVDVTQHKFVRDTYLPATDLDLYIKEVTNGKDFLEKEVYLPVTCFSVPRKGRSSTVIHVGPLPTYEVVVLDDSTVENPEKLVVKRSLGENFFNQVHYDLDYSPISDAYETPKTYDSEIKDDLMPEVGDRPLNIPSKGLRSTSDGAGIADRAARRYLKRYERGAEFIKGIKVSFRVGYQIEIGDIVAVDYAALQLGDFKTGTRQGDIRLMEVLNKVLDNKTGEVVVDVVNTIFQVNDRFGLISPATLTDVGSTTSKLVIKKSYGTKPFERESNKWQGYANQAIRVRTADFTTIYNTVLRGFDNNDPQGMAIDPIPAAPGEDWIIESRPYPSSTDKNELAFWKVRHAYFSPQVQVANAVAISQVEFEVDPADIAKFLVGASVRVHNYSYTDDGPEALVTDVNMGTYIVTIDTPTGFGINSTHYVDLIGFADSQPAYRII